MDVSSLRCSRSAMLAWSVSARDPKQNSPFAGRFWHTALADASPVSTPRRALFQELSSGMLKLVECTSREGPPSSIREFEVHP